MDISKQKSSTCVGLHRRGFFNAAMAAAAATIIARQLAADEKPRELARVTPDLDTKNEFKPGEIIPVSGIYDVIHDKLDGEDHALPHQVVARAGDVFPPCRWCGEEVRFCLHHGIAHVDSDPNFKT